MSIITANGKDVMSACIRIPRQGVWIADLSVDVNSIPDNSIEINIKDGAMILNGTAVRNGQSEYSTFLRVVGGGGKLTNNITPKHYKQSTARIIANDILSIAELTISNTSSLEILNRQLGNWVSMAGTATEALTQLTDELGAVWRVLLDGSVWIGTETWPTVELDDYELESESPQTNQAVYNVQTPALLPGVVFAGKRTSVVLHSITLASIKTTVLFELDSDTLDRQQSPLANVVRSQVAHLDYFALYPANVIAQNGDKTLELKPEDSRLPGMSKVPIRYGIPGVVATVVSGSRVLLGFENGNPQSPIVVLWDSVTPVKIELSATQIVLNSGTLPIARQSDMAGPYPISGPCNLTVLG